MKCPYCNSESISETYDWASFDNNMNIRKKVPSVKGKDAAYSPESARVCLNCGYFMIEVMRGDTMENKT